MTQRQRSDIRRYVLRSADRWHAQMNRSGLIGPARENSLVGSPSTNLDQRLGAMHDTLRNLLIVIRSVANSQGADFADPSPARSDWQAAPASMRSDVQQAYQ